MALELARVVADRLSRPRLEVENIQLEIMRADIWPRDHCEQLALLALAVLFGATVDNAASVAAKVLLLVDSDGDKAVTFVAGLVRALVNLTDKNGLPPGLAYRSTIYAENGDGLAVRVRFSCDDGAEELAFSDDPHGYQPDRDLSVSLSLGMPGRILFRLARDLAELHPPIEYRTFPATWTVK